MSRSCSLNFLKACVTLGSFFVKTVALSCCLAGNLAALFCRGPALIFCLTATAPGFFIAA